MEIKELREEFNKFSADFRKENDELIESKTSLQFEKVEKLQDHIDAVEKKFTDFELASTVDEKKEVKNEYQSIVLDYLKKGESQMGAETKAKLIVGDASQGGYLVHPEFDNTIVKKVTEIDRIREFARVTTISGPSLVYPKRETLLQGSWSGEQGDVQEGASTYGQGEIVVHELDVIVPISVKLLQDSFANMEQEISMDVAEAFAQTEGDAFVNGDDVAKPQGILQGGSEEVDTIGSNAINADDLYNLMFSLKTNYVRGANFYGNRLILRDFRKLKDTTNQYILQTAQSGSITYNLLGHNFVETPSMASDLTVDNQKVLIFADLFRGYRIVDRTGMSVLRDPYTAKVQKMVEFMFSKRVGGKVVLPEAIKILNVLA